MLKIGLPTHVKEDRRPFPVSDYFLTLPTPQSICVYLKWVGHIMSNMKSVTHECEWLIRASTVGEDLTLT